MKKLISILLTAAMLVCMTAFAVPVSAATTQVVTIAAPETIEVDPGQQYVALTWTITENQGWGAFKMFVEFDGDVFSFAPGGEIGYSDEQGTFAFFIDDARTYRNNIGAVTTNIFGIDNGVDPTITKHRSALLVEGKSNTEDSTATGDFFTAFLNIAADAAPGEYEVKITTDPNNCSSVKGAAVAVPVMTWGTAKVVVKGELPPAPEADDRLNVTGAQIRIPNATAGITEGFRFVSTITTELYDELAAADALPKSAADTGVGFGSVVIPTSLIPAGGTLTKETAGAAIVPAVKLYKAPAAGDTEYMFTACLTNYTASKAILERSLTVVPYVTYMEGEDEVTVYGVPYATSIYEVAKAAYESGKETGATMEYLNNEILYVVDSVTYPKDSWTGIYRP